MKLYAILFIVAVTLGLIGAILGIIGDKKKLKDVELVGDILAASALIIIGAELFYALFNILYETVG